MHNWTDTLGLDERPNEEGNTSGRDKECLDGEKMTDLVDREPDSWQTTSPEEEEANEIPGIGSGARG